MGAGANLDGTSGYEEYKNVNEIFIHPEYEPVSHVNDLAVLRVRKKRSLDKVLHFSLQKWQSNAQYFFLRCSFVSPSSLSSHILYLTPIDEVMHVLDTSPCSCSFFPQLSHNFVFVSDLVSPAVLSPPDTPEPATGTDLTVVGWGQDGVSDMHKYSLSRLKIIQPYV